MGEGHTRLSLMCPSSVAVPTYGLTDLRTYWLLAGRLAVARGGHDRVGRVHTDAAAEVRDLRVRHRGRPEALAHGDRRDEVHTRRRLVLEARGRRRRLTVAGSRPRA